MLYREIIAVCSEIETKHINTLCGQNVELLNVKILNIQSVLNNNNNNYLLQLGCHHVAVVILHLYKT